MNARPRSSTPRATARAARCMLLAAGTIALCGPAQSEARDRAPPYRNPDAPIAQRVDDLLGRMTLEERVGQIITLWASKGDVMYGIVFNADKA